MAKAKLKFSRDQLRLVIEALLMAEAALADNRVAFRNARTRYTMLAHAMGGTDTVRSFINWLIGAMK